VDDPTRHDGVVREPHEPDRAAGPGGESGAGDDLLGDGLAARAGDGPDGSGGDGLRDDLPPGRPEETLSAAGFRRLATRICDAVLDLVPEDAPAGSRASRAGRLRDLSAEGVEHAEAVLADALAALDAVDDTVLEPGDVVDLEILRVWVAGRQWDLMDRRHEHDPLAHIPDRLLPVTAEGPAVDTGAVDTAVGLLRCAVGRLEALPTHLAQSQAVLHDLSRPAVDAAILRVRRLSENLWSGMDALLAPLGGVEAAAPAVPGVHDAVVDATYALEEHRAWLESVRPAADTDPRLGAQRYAARLWYDLDVELDPDALLVRAESDLLAVEEELAELAGLLGAAAGGDGVRDLLRDVARDPGDPAPNAGVAHARAAAALAEVERDVRGLDLVTVPDGVVPDGLVPAGRCPLADGLDVPLPDTPPVTAVGGALRRVAAAHAAVPGHAVQAAHAARAVLPTAARRVVPSLLFVEGWAVHAEGLLTLSDAGTPAQRARRRVAHLALQLRRAARCIVDVRCHVQGMSHDAAVALLVERAHLSAQAAAALVDASLVHPVRGSVGYVGDHLVSDVVARLGAVRPDDGARVVHDRVLSFGAMPPRHLAVLLGLPAESSGRR